MKTELVNKLSRSANTVLLKVKKHSPELLVGAGVVGTVAATVMACKATTKLDGILQESREKLETIHNYVEENGYSEEYTEQDSKKDLVITYTQTVLKVSKLYAPAVIVGGVSIAAILGGHNILRKRNIALGAAYVAIDNSFKNYRSNVVERFGKNIDEELRYGLKQKEVEEVVKNEDGTEEIVKKTVDEYTDPQFSEYSRLFDEFNDNWTRDPMLNKKFLLDCQSWANEKLKRKGILFLNEVYEMLGFDKVPAGQIVGWIYSEDNPVGDNYVDFGIFRDTDYIPKRNFINGIEKSIILDFNPDGPVYDKL